MLGEIQKGQRGSFAGAFFFYTLGICQPGIDRHAGWSILIQYPWMRGEFCVLPCMTGVKKVNICMYCVCVCVYKYCMCIYIHLVLVGAIKKKKKNICKKIVIMKYYILNIYIYIYIYIIYIYIYIFYIIVFSIFWNVIYSCDGKAEFSSLLYSFQYHMILPKYSNILIWCSRNISD